MHTVILHGWSDCSKSFVNIKKYLEANNVGTVDTIYYADYESREDNVTFNDVVDGLNDQFIAHGFISEDGKKKKDLNVVVHSTGGLVIRHWIWRYYYRDGNRIAECPVKRLVMLAPANFGSPLAKRGKSLLGGLVKGRWKVGDLFEVGERLLNGLELASPYQWDLAHKDLFIGKPYFNEKQIQTTILVGIEDYDGIRGWVNKAGTDGTVVIAGTSIDSAKLVIDHSGPKSATADDIPSRWTVTKPPSRFGFGVLRGLDHGSVVSTVGKKNDPVGPLLVRALRCRSPEEFLELADELEEVTRQTYAAYPSGEKPVYQQFLIRPVDDHDVPVREYTVDFFVCRASRVKGGVVSAGVERPKKKSWSEVVYEALSESERRWSAAVHRELTREFVENSQDKSLRRFLVDIQKVEELLKAAEKELGGSVALAMSLFVPDVDRGIRYDNQNTRAIVLIDPAQKKGPSFLYPNTTTLLELKVNRVTGYVQVGLEPKKH